MNGANPNMLEMRYKNRSIYNTNLINVIYFIGIDTEKECPHYFKTDKSNNIC